MEVTMDPPGTEPAAAPAAPPEKPEGPAQIELTRGTMVIEGQVRDTVSATVAGHALVWTPRLSFMEAWDVERFMDQKDMGGPGSTRLMAIATVRSIDGMPCGFPGSEVAVRGRINELGDRAARFVWRQYLMNSAGAEDEVKN